MRTRLTPQPARGHSCPQRASNTMHPARASLARTFLALCSRRCQPALMSKRMGSAPIDASSYSRRERPLSSALVASALLLVLSGCATPEANPPAPSAKKGYADFYADPSRDIYWKIEQWDPRASKFKSFYSKFGAPTNGFLRLELAPGRHRLRISFVNLSTEGPVEVDVEIVPEKITPVQVNYAVAGDTYVRSVEDKARHGGRRREVT